LAGSLEFSMHRSAPARRLGHRRSPRAGGR
jgi:hypothetical protein